MSDVREQDLILYDPLSEVTRRERKVLLGVAMLGVALVKVPLVPEKLGFFGVEFAKVNQATFLGLYALVVGFFLAAFCVYALSDYVAWRRKAVIQYARYTQLQKEEKSPKRATLDEFLDGDPGQRGNPAYRGLASWGTALGVARLRAAFEFLIPIVFACYSIVELLLYRGVLK